MAEHVDITVMINAHREGPLLAMSIRSAVQALQRAETDGWSGEIILVLDRTDEITRTIAERHLGPGHQTLATDFGDPGQARNHGIARARGRTLALLDGDDLFGKEWLARGFEMLSREGLGNTCLHPAWTVIFGEEKAIWRHIGMEHPDFRPRHLMFENGFTNLSFAPTHVFRSVPFRATAFDRHLGHEDWAWMRETTHLGIRHLVVPQTLHAVRRKRSSRLVQSRAEHHLPIPTPMFSGRDFQVGLRKR